VTGTAFFLGRGARRNRAPLAKTAAGVDHLGMTMPIHLRFVRLTLAAVLALAASACGSAVNGGPAAPSTPAAAPQDLAARIALEIGDAACDSSAQCRTLAYGHKACGGPEKYLAYSTKRSDGARLTQLAGQLADERRRQDEREGMMSTCSVVVDPGAACNAGRCVLQPQGPGGAPLAR
jgi:hypothetical protein